MTGRANDNRAWLAVKAVRGRADEIEILVPYGGPFGRGVDSAGDYFDRRTDFSVPGLPDLPRPVVYAHAVRDDAPQAIGKAVGIRETAEGRWYRVVLDPTQAQARKSLDALRRGTLRASSQAVFSFIRRVRDAIGERVTHWPLVELTLVDTQDGFNPVNPFAVVQPAVAKATLAQVGLSLTGGEAAEAAGQQRQPGTRKYGRQTNHGSTEGADVGVTESMENDELQEMVTKAAADAASEAVSAALDRQSEEAAAARRRLPGGEAPNVARYGELWRYDHLSPGDQAILVGMLKAAQAAGISRGGATESAQKALAMKPAEDESRVGAVGRNVMKAHGLPLKADEIMYQSLSGFGDEWVGVAYSQQLWEAIRQGTFVAQRLPSIEVPPGHESITIPLEGADPTFYKVAEATDTAASGWPSATITTSQAGTANKSLALAKMGARVLWSGELEEDSLVPFVPELRRQLELAGAEQLEHAIIDGDTAAGATANINDIAGTPAATDLFLMFDGFRKLPLVTQTANSRDGGTLAAADFLETIELMGNAGINALDRDRVEFILDVNTHWKALELAEVKSQDVFSKPTVENGQLSGIWGYNVNVSPFMHFKSADRKANADGKIDQDVTANNTTGAILAVRWDQWLLGYRRKMTIETSRIARADTTEIVALARVGLVHRDNEAAAISYNLTV